MENTNNTLLYNQEISSWFVEYLKITKISEVAADLAYYNYEWRYITLVIFNTFNYIGVGRFAKFYEKAIFVQRGFDIPTAKSLILQNVIYGESTNNLIDMLHMFRNLTYNNDGKYIVVCVSINDTNCNENTFFKACLALDIVNVIFLRFPYNTDSLEPLAFTYNPIEPGICKNYKAMRLNISSNCLYKKCFKNAYPEKYSNFYGCEIIVSTFEQKPIMHIDLDSNTTAGEDGDLLKLLMKTINASLTISIPPNKVWGTYKNQSWTGSLGDVYNRKVNFSMTSAPLTLTRYNHFQISVPYGFMDIVWVAKWPQLKKTWAQIINPFSLGLRILLLLIFVIIATVHVFSKTKKWNKIRKILKIGPPRSNPLFYSWLICLGNPVLKLPSKPALLTITYLFIWFCLVIRNIYQAILISSLKLKIYEDNLLTIYDVLKTDKKFGGTASLKEYFEGNPEIYDNYVEIQMDDVDSLLEAIEDETLKFVVAVNIKPVLRHLGYFHESQTLYIIPEKIVSSPTVLYFKKYSSLGSSLDKLLIRTMESGITDRLYKRYVEANRKLSEQTQNDIPVALNMENFTGTFLLILLGWIYSTIVFAMELIYKQYV